jgi:hypothetical protein
METKRKGKGEKNITFYLCSHLQHLNENQLPVIRWDKTLLKNNDDNNNNNNNNNNNDISLD